MISFSEWMVKKGLLEQDLYKKYGDQQAASVAQALASAGDNPNPDIVARAVSNDPKLKSVTPKGLKPDPETVKADVAASLKNRQQQFKKSAVAAGVKTGA